MGKLLFAIIPGEPKGKARPRFSRRGVTYTPTTTKSYEQTVKAEWRSTNGQAAFLPKIPLACEIVAYFAPPESESRKKQLDRIKNQYATKRPDADNIAKIILDALNGVAFHDDAQVVKLIVTKRYATEPYVTIALTECEVDGNV
ncbi:MAG TPA: RusA family crossover junction endodeoxyribonuclease [Clostridiales bacterium]|nr:RusA family crossover junction endodeoxyribonuclease [Clostridiales bacterium]